MSKPNGGPAFPETHVHKDWNTNAPGWLGKEGMTLRDYFAAKAMSGLLLSIWKEGEYPIISNRVAELSYNLADAMLAERGS